MNQKKDDLPAMPFYVGDWLKSPDIRALSPAAKGLWIDMLCFMWESKERGVLILGEKVVDREILSRMTGFARDLLDPLLEELEDFAIYSIREDGAIYSRKMVKMQEIRQIRAESGQKGGFAKAKRLAKSQQITENENENENENESNKTFKPPTVDEVRSYCVERNNGVNPEAFISFYESKGWMIGKNKMKDWKAAVRTWEQKQLHDSDQTKKDTKGASVRGYDETKEYLDNLG